MKLNLSITIDCPPGDVYGTFIKIPEWADRIPAISKIEMHTEGETVIGTEFTETRIMFGKEAQETMTVTGLEADSAGAASAQRKTSGRRQNRRRWWNDCHAPAQRPAVRPRTCTPTPRT